MSEQRQGHINLSTQRSGYEHECTRLHHLGPNALQGHACEVTGSQSAIRGYRSPTARHESPAIYPGGESERKDRETTLWENMLDEFDWHQEPSGFVCK